MPKFLSLRTCASLAFAALALTALAGCKTNLVPQCPAVRVDNATASVTKFRDGGTQTAGDVEYRADILGFKGECDFDEDPEDGKVDVTFNIDFAVTGGPAAKGGDASLYYFVAIPQFFPDTNGKSVLIARAKLPERAAARETFTESNVRVRIPLKDGQAGAGFDVYVGFQLDAAQLEYNRSQSTR